MLIKIMKHKQNINNGNSKFPFIIILAVIILCGVAFFIWYQAQKNKVVYVPPVTYDQDAEKRLVAMLHNHPELSPSDQTARITLSHIENPIYQTPQYTMKYDNQMQEVIVEILTTDVNGAKDDAVKWLESKGLSAQGVCTLPVEFILNDKAAEYLRGKNIVISPLASGC
jgi:hypothetical protein